MPARTLIVWGCSSGAGKSLLATALCRWAANAGYEVAPYKAQNMSNNARVVPLPNDGSDGGEGFGEIGSAQYFQALAARVRPTVDMNPVLLKPEADTRSQVVLNGRVARELAEVPWRERSHHLAQAARAGFERLHAAHELLIVEGAGSPAEINLADHDFVNLGVARWAQACGPTQALLVSDIDRGGAFAHLHGTWALMPDDLRPLLSGWVLNKFRGDATLLAPGPALLQARTGVPLLGVLPLLRHHGLPEEDGLYGVEPARGGASDALRIAILAGPHISNLDEFLPLSQLPGVRLVWARERAHAEDADWLILPGSKQASGDGAWLRAQGLDTLVQAHAAAGKPVLGICGGLQLLGQTLADPEGLDGVPHAGQAGLGLLPLHTHYQAPKRLRTGRLTLAGLHGPWAGLNGVATEGYEIRCGRTEGLPQATPVAWADDGHPIGWQQGSALGLYAHGLLEQPAFLRALFGAQVPLLDTALDRLADALEAAVGRPGLIRLMGC
ncbi:cobyric acid synthase [Inhella gelatinilytica]|uniref:Cobyric acid synthase n=1 Tax=Inhella gelatinilytica TaxID=2795030 RepID=A0A931ND64_9BURK|nr:cobyric acid synthase [Inhella gelatinilytica]MBH9552274.1 cobyric acid synthase [Inhella gelatinilytica]